MSELLVGSALVIGLILHLRIVGIPYDYWAKLVERLASWRGQRTWGNFQTGTSQTCIVGIVLNFSER